MPVSVLLCEGNNTSPDARVLNKLLAGLCEVKPFGGKYGMGDRILARREVLGATSVFGLLDGDFREWTVPKGIPISWVIEPQNSKQHIGWRWERKEIENYLIDPVVVARALGALPDDYEALLRSTAVSLSAYQAARITLTLHRPRFSPLQNSFGTKHGDTELPEANALDAVHCLDAAKDVIQRWNEHRSLDDVCVEATFNRVLPECEEGGARFMHFVTGFAGKDLLWGMSAGLAKAGFSSPRVFLERILVGISKSSDNVAAWLPEWTALRELVAQ